VSETSYGAYSIYESNGSKSWNTLGALGGEWYVLGTREAVTDCIDVEREETSGFSGPLRRAAKSIPDAPVVSVGRMAPWLRPGRLLDAPSNFELESADGIRALSGSMHGTGRTRTLTLTVHANNGDTAGDLAQLFEGYIGLVAAKEDADGVMPTLAADSTVERRNSRVIVSTEKSVDQLETIGSTVLRS
jgi:hypothetical protein